ncbi:alpha-2-macroglobulin family protein [Undibacterium sp. Rencai35W]|uniref:alpha-2-macroglobulin family protein n=1 Tax=Undibacterium sp. Rencai35W TaxID=3413046 RepID=UPI003BF14D11
MMNLLHSLKGFSALLIASFIYNGNADAASISRFTPQGEVAQVRQVRVTFSEAVIAFGDPKAATPFDVKCSQSGSGRWADDKNWVYDFAKDLPPGTQCNFQVKIDFKTPSGSAITGKTVFQFSTGGPAVLRAQPYEYDRIDEEQAFILYQNGPATSDTLLKHVYCEIEGVHERVPVRFVDATIRADLLKQFAGDFTPEHISVVQCQQRFPNDAAVRVVWDKGILTPNGIPNSQKQAYKFQVRPAFSATFSCQRENANAACTPIQSLGLYFNTPVSRKLAEQISLKTAKGTVKPVFSRDEKNPMVQRVDFAAPFAEKTEYSIVLPSDFKDETGRPLSNASQFPVRFSTADYPPLAKFSAAPFGIVELNADATLPVTLRNVEKNLILRNADGRQSPGTLANLKLDDDAGIIRWINKLNKYHESTVRLNGKDIESRSLGLLSREAGARKIELPTFQDVKDAAPARPFEVIGIPLKDPGFYVLELESQKLGSALLGKPVPMYVRTSALVTNLAVHIKLGRENGAVWVTTLDNAKPVAGADVRLSNCLGKELWRGTTGANGVALIPESFPDPCIDNEMGEVGNGSRSSDQLNGFFVSARKTDDKGRKDIAFALSSWNNGIESYRFNLPTDVSKAANVRAHTILDRSLLRAGETVSMKHVIRVENMQGFALQKTDLLPDRVRIIHQGSNQEFQFPLTWRNQNAAETVFAIPKQAKLGRYDILLDKGSIKSATEIQANQGNERNTEMDEDGRYAQNSILSGSFRVEEFRLPLLQGRITPPKQIQIAPKELPLDVQLNYLNGGGASGLAVQITSLLRSKAISFPNFDGFSFYSGADNDDEQKIVANKLPVTLDKNGSGKTVIKNLPDISKPQELLSEMTYADPNGEIQTISAITPVWSSAVIVGIKTGSWISVKKKMSLVAVTLDTSGKPQAGVAVSLFGINKQNNSHRKRMVGGFYAYENAETNKDLGELCSGKSDEHGMFFCDADLKASGNIEITVKAKDSIGKISSAKTSVWASDQNETWFEGENQDRMDILPEKKQYQAGETAKFQVRMPFRYATALVAIEREGVIDTMVVQLNGRDPSISVPIKASYGPNVFVSVLAVRGRMREVPWYSFFTWGWKEPLNWWSEFREYQAPSALVDLAKPAYKYGIAEIAVGTSGNQLKVNVSSDKTTYPIRSTSKITIQVTRPDGKPAAGAEIAVAAVDEALLELQPNTSWDLLGALLQRRSYGIETATAQMQVIGKRHYGRKAVAAGGGGGKSSTRELFDTLLLWKSTVILDANGMARLDVPLNDALTSFKIVAIAQSGTSLFGTGSTSIRSTQDLQIISGLPPLVREGDQFSAMVTVRNTTTRAMQVDVSATVTGSLTELPKQNLNIPAGEARELNWRVVVPASNINVATAFSSADTQVLVWNIKAQETTSGATAGVKDAVKITQRVITAVPVTVQQASLFQLDKPVTMAVVQPADSLPGRGGLAISLIPNLAVENQGIRRYFAEYPYACLEQKTSKAIGLRDMATWQRITADLPTYLDKDGLAYYYPPSEQVEARGSDSLTAYLLSATSEAGFALPDASRDKMLQGLSAFVEGKITRNYWSPKKDLDARKLAALEAMSRYTTIQPRLLGSIQIAPNLWPTSAVIDWLAVLQRTVAIPKRDSYIREADQILRSRLNYQGTRLGFSTEADDYWWWLMSSADSNAARLILVMLDNAEWRDDMPKLMTGAIQRQIRGHWGTTTANVWGSLALEKFAKKFESEKVAGVTKASWQQAMPTTIASQGQNFSWPATGGGNLQLAWPVTGSAATKATDGLKLIHEGKGKPWILMQSLAAIPLKVPFSSGYRISKTMIPVEQKEKGKYSRGDIIRVNLEIDAQTDMTWVVVSDPVPAGASLLGSGLGRDSLISATAKADNSITPSWNMAWLTYEERSFEDFRGYYEFVPKGKFTLSYTMRLNNEGEFKMPQTRVEAMYAPEMFGEYPNPVLIVK